MFRNQNAQSLDQSREQEQEIHCAEGDPEPTLEIPEQEEQLNSEQERAEQEELKEEPP